MDTQMYALSIPTLIMLWGMSKGQAGLLGTVVLMMAALGGWSAGMLADRFGRVRVLQATILWFSAFTFLAGLTHSFGELLVARSLQGLGFGGEWAVGSVLISEAVGPKVRGRVVGAIQAGWAIGYAIAVLLSTLLFSLLPPDIAWRVFFFIGAAPGLLVLWIRRNIADPPIFAGLRATRDRAAGFWTIFAPAHAWTTVRGLLLTTGIYGGNYVLITWLPTYLRTDRGLSVVNTGLTLGVNIAGSFCGAFLNGWMADAFGRRRTFVVIALLQGLAVATYTLAPIAPITALVLAFALGTLQSGTAAGTGAFLAELFPTAIRGSAQGFCGNGGRALGAVMPTFVGVLSAAMPLGVAMGLCACAAYGLVVLAALMLPETRGRDLGSLTVEEPVQ
ncbi:MAG TPA: MFS transporter [Caulobacteraceae bacterium]|nr:MFS transporter [Caulobacteraceae bacterium]